MFVTLAVLLVALGAFTVMVARIRPDPPREPDVERIRGFGYVGAAGASCVAVAVLIVGLAARNPRAADSVALLGLFGYVVYQLAAWAIIAWPTRRWPRRPVP